MSPFGPYVPRGHVRCSICGKRNGHNAKTCPDRGKQRQDVRVCEAHCVRYEVCGCKPRVATT